MTDYEVREMQRLIDAGIQLAHKRLLARARFDQQVLVFAQDGKVIEKIPEGAAVLPSREGDPLIRHRVFKD
ncbi:MAG: hypothetical protein J6P55_05180 [Bacteroidaceae bacterium]|nr:hypothetical protein [Bacteroidaceae bacterium]MBR1902141.1 hypothetical protein [Bacteroidaceae bacterium]